MRGVLMTASAQLGNRLAAASGSAGRERAVPGSVRPVRPTALTQPLPAPPAPVPPVAPAVPQRSAPSSMHRQAPAREAADARAARPSVRSGRVASLIAAAVVTLALVTGLGWLGQATNSGIPERTTVVRVGAGETVWDVAARVAPRSDQRVVVERIRQLNGMVGTAVRPDQQLKVPDGR
jgi:LysM domain